MPRWFGQPALTGLSRMVVLVFEVKHNQRRRGRCLYRRNGIVPFAGEQPCTIAGH